MTSIKDLPSFDAADYLDSLEARADYVAAALEEGDAAEIRRALNSVTRRSAWRRWRERRGLDTKSKAVKAGRYRSCRA